jgi:lysozyme family protein
MRKDVSFSKEGLIPAISTMTVLFQILILHLQKIVGVMGDGTLGNLTLASCCAMKSEKLLELLNQERLSFIKKIPNYNLYGKGWENRIATVYHFCQGLMK